MMRLLCQHVIGFTFQIHTRSFDCIRVARFIKLPPWVKVLLTSRPQVLPSFKGWQPKWIEPEDERNLADMLELLRWRLQQGGHVQESDLDAAAQLMVEKSQVGREGGVRARLNGTSSLVGGRAK